MWWIIAGAVLLMFIVAVVLMLKRSAAKDAENSRRRREALDEMRRKLKPGVRFKAYGSFGNVINGQVIEVTNSRSIKAWCKAYDDQPGEIGPFPIDRIYEFNE